MGLKCFFKGHIFLLDRLLDAHNCLFGIRIFALLWSLEQLSFLKIYVYFFKKFFLARDWLFFFV